MFFETVALISCEIDGSIDPRAYVSTRQTQVVIAEVEINRKIKNLGMSPNHGLCSGLSQVGRLQFELHLAVLPGDRCISFSCVLISIYKPDLFIFK